MSDILQRLSGLSAKEKRELLAQTLRESPAKQKLASASPHPMLLPAPGERYQPFPLTPIQQAYWIGRGGAFELGNVGAHAYFEVDMPRLDLQKSSQALQKVITRHDMLRAVLRPDGQQEVLESVPPYEIQVTDVRGLDSDQAAARLEAVRQRMSRQVFPVDRWPLFELHAAYLDEQHTRLHFSFDLLICDLRSAQIFLDEWLQFYINPNAPFLPLELSFRDYVLAERAWQDSDPCRRSREYWRERIPALPPAPELPLAKPAGAVSHPRFVRRTTKLEPQLWAQLKKLARQCGLTPASVLLAAFAEVLTTWGRSPQFTLNVILFNRQPLHAQVNDLVGEFTSMILLGVDNSGQGSFQARATRIQQQFWNDLDHRHFHGLSVLRELARLQGGGPRALMPIVFTCDVVHDFISPQRASSSLMPGEFVYGISQTPQVFLDHQAWEQGGALVLNWDAVEELFPEGLLSDMFDAEVRLLHRLIGEASAWQEISPPLAPAAQLALRAAVNATKAPVDFELLQAPFDTHVLERPRQPAVVARGRTLTYEELSRHSSDVARRLRDLGARPNTLVAVVMDKGWEQVVAVLGILRSGAAYLPIDPELPKERLRFLLENGEAQVVLTQSWLRESLPWPPAVQLLCVDTEDLEDVEDHLPGPAQGPDDLAYVIYTSGSTGVPKGVMIDHRGACNTIADINRRFDVGPRDRVLALSSLNFDLSVYDIFGTLAAGGTIVIPEAAAVRDPSGWRALMEQEQVTIWNSVPVLMEMLVRQVIAESTTLPPSLRLVMLSGDWIPIGLPSQINSLAKNARLISLGGATEASIWSILHPIEEVAPGWKSIPYGKPMTNQHFAVLSEALQPCPEWVPGQLYIGGIGLAKGYWRDETKTRASFIRHPHTGARLYRTGDVGRYLPSGDIEFLGREDLQVKIHGHRIEIGEIEDALGQHPGVRDVVVAAVGEERTNKRLVAYLVADREPAPAIEELHDFLRAKLPEYMVPATMIFLAALPMTSTGKVDRKALPKPEPAASATDESSAVPLSPAGVKIAQIVADVLGVEKVPANQELMSMGIDSLGMMQIAARFDETFGFRPMMKDIFRLTTVSALAEYYDEYQIDGARPESGPNVGGDIRSNLASSFKVLLDPREREEFKKQQAGLRRPDGDIHQMSLPLPGSLDEALGKTYSLRRSHRHFSPYPISVEQFGKLLSPLRQFQANGSARRLYGSGGGLYPVQTYLHVKQNRVQGVNEGAYYYHPRDHHLVSLSGEAPLHRGIHLPANRLIFDAAAFSIFLIGRLSAIAPIYGDGAMRFVLIEAGLIAQLLEMAAPHFQIGLCQIGSLHFEKIRSAFSLDDSDVFLHALLGGGIEEVRSAQDGDEEAKRDHIDFSPETRRQRLPSDSIPGEREEGIL